MERRQEPRRARRLQVAFWKPGSENRSSGFSTNISAGGIFIATRHPLRAGERLRMEVSSGEQGFVVEGVVVRAVRSPPALQTVRASGMGVRFLPVRELVSELLPQIGATPQRLSEARQDGVYRVRFQNRQQLLAAYHRDIRTGGLFVPTAQPAAVGETVTVRLEVAEQGFTPVEIQARVVQSFEPQGHGGGQPNLLAGMGVELLDPEACVERVRGMIERPFN